MEMIMSTLAVRAAGALASAVEPRPGLTFIGWLLAAREDAAKRRVVAHLAAMDDARLQGLGFNADDIAALHSGEYRLPR
jgi:hypothetical protein